MSTNPLEIIDISEVNTDSADRLLEAARTQGFLFIKGHSFTAKEIASVFELSEEFFKLPFEYKSKYAIDMHNHGYTGYGVETLDPEKSAVGDPKEALNIGSMNFESGKSSKVLPDWFDEAPERRKLIEDTAKKLYDTKMRLLKLLAIGLKIESEDGKDGSEWFESRFEPTSESGTILRFLHYPSVSSTSPEVKIRAGAHTDYGAMTLLFQQPNQEGLQIYSPMSKQWESVPYVPAPDGGEGAPIVVNIGDLLSYWTAGYLKSTIHRVQFPEGSQFKDRYSVVFFSHPNDATALDPVPSPLLRSLKSRGAFAASEVITAKEHLQRRLAASYGWDKK
ncbi:hypothetical protein FT663_05001 [Candidozyma haemuli var. vulneris]|uniref:Fe2OG dioxygenase domain-containing protein n=1 Tax=Candidozyma haemuli TaxID=45357 RepID=A0A2V1B240_9ASCO|nr:hypothetical protein CXQ85_003731 [[Candida] haemuloni]KAF3985847.1 hypothetical protein FT662_04900 [[Candida] haemuloni var. vulneris]KAF3986140.1 hypothetical protein FT663_05001 [[Candida] haemuloni var. vulneris]PVH23441.1 hypothetical protein CXQ85_003731 [[Candida] haemuloni]